MSDESVPMDPALRSMICRQEDHVGQLAEQVRERPDEIALRVSGVPTTWAELSDRVDRLADGLHERGVRFGDPVSIMMMNRGAFFQAVLAVHRLGAVAVPINHRVTPEQITPILQDACSRSLLVDAPLVALGAQVRDLLEVSTALVVVGTPEGGTGRAPLAVRAEDETQPAIDFFGLPLGANDEAASDRPDQGEAEEFGPGDARMVSFPRVTGPSAEAAEVSREADRLLDQVVRREVWLQASTEITRQLLSGVGQNPLQVIARRLQEVAEADLVNVVVPASDAAGGQSLTVQVATGAGAAQLIAHTYPVHNTMCQQILDGAEAVQFDEGVDKDQPPMRMGEVVPVGPVMMLPLAGIGRIRGVMIVGRLRGNPTFTDDDLIMATTFANHAAVALEMADIRESQAQSAVLEDRERIARDLHDHVIQQLFGAGLKVESIAGRVGAVETNTAPGVETLSERLSQVVVTIDETIGQIRTSIFQLRGPLGPETGQARFRLLAVADEAAATLGFEPKVSFTGPVDSVVPDALLDELVAVVREALTNVARHADATWVDLNVKVRVGELILEFTDDGVGIGVGNGEPERISGLDNLRRRASLYGGTLTVQSPSQRSSRPDLVGGTNLLWSIPLP